MTEPTKEAVAAARAWTDSIADVPENYTSTTVKAAITLRDALTASEAREAALREQVKELEAEDEKTFNMGKEEGASDAVQEIDILTGGDGEYRYVMGADPDDSHCPGPVEMIARIKERFEVSQARIATLEAENAKLRDALTWYGEMVRSFKSVLHHQSEKARRSLFDDGGNKARAALVTP